jgi:sec-independent protein translocase protein TatC
VTVLEAGSEEGEPPSEIDESRAPLLSHLEELRSRLIRSIAIFILVFIGAFFISDRLYQIMTMPLHDALGANARLITTEVTGQFWVKVEVASDSALIVGSPFIANQLWLFIAPGLYRSERKLLKPYLFATPVLFSAGVAMGYFLMPYALRALLIGPFALVDKKSVIPVSVTPDVHKYLTFAKQMMFGFGISFLFPILLMVLVQSGVLTVEQLRKGRRYAITAAFLISTLLAPPDVQSQLMLAIPLCLLFEVTLLYLRYVKRAK